MLFWTICRFQVRFSNPVLPGNRLRTEMWKSREVKNRVHFQTINLETKKVCLAGAYMDLHEAAAGDEEEVEVEVKKLEINLQYSLVYFVFNIATILLSFIE